MLFERFTRQARPLAGAGLLLLWVSTPGFCATFLVTNVNDTGAGSLRQAILDANQNTGPDEISFRIGSGGPRTISPRSPLPPITEPLTIDGTTQPGFNSEPLIELSGVNAGETAGLRLLGGGAVIKGLVVNRFALDGIRIEGVGTNVIQGNYIGTDRTGTAVRGNTQQGVFVYSSWGNVIGGTNPTERNLISGNGDAGVYLVNGGAHRVLGNFIGCTANGQSPLGNTNNGVAIYNSRGNQIGWPDSSGRNLISGNRASGVYLFGSQSISNSIQGNYIGTDVSGTSSLSNLADGVTLTGAPRNLVGGNHPGSGNLISGNGHAGIYVMAVTSVSNIIAGNRIGCDASGLKALGNTLSGITLSGCSGTLVGGQNLISGNRQEGLLLTTNATRNYVVGNRIGVDGTGLARLGNGFSGLTVVSGAVSNQFGGATAETGNLISGNTNFGILLADGSARNLVQGNLIGVGINGTTPVPNTSGGLRIESAGNIIGGSEPGARNLISGNGGDGVLIIDRKAEQNQVLGNFIGTDRHGTAPLMNNRAGVAIFNAPRNQIGGPGTAGNVLSGNNDSGIFLIGSQAAENVVAGNKIGTDATGNTALPNRYEGVLLWQAPSNTVGGTTAELGNLVSANAGRGIYLTNASWNVLQGNRIGLKSDGVTGLGNKFHGIDCERGSTNNLIGGDGTSGNRIGFAQTVYTGVRVRNGSAGNGIFNNSIFGNGALGIDLGAAGILPADPCDADTGANQQQNAPVLQVAVNQPLTTIRGQLETARGGVYRVQFFLNDACDPGGNGEGSNYLGEYVVSAGDSCTVAFEHQLSIAAPEGSTISATATDAANNTSEFSNCALVQAPPVLTVSPVNQRMVALSWPAGTQQYAVQFTTSLTPPVRWQSVRGIPALEDGRYTLNIPFAQKAAYFILVRE